MSTTAMPFCCPPPTFNTLDPFQRARLVRTTRKLGRVLGTTPILLDATEPHELHDLNELLPIGPKFGSGSRSVTSSPSKSQASKLLKTKAARRHGSLFNIPISLNPSANLSSSSLSSVSTQSSTASAGTLRETKGFSSGRQRKANAPTPLVLKVKPVPSVTADSQLPIKPESKSLVSPVAPPSHACTNTIIHRRSRSSSTILSSTSAGVPTPLTPSFRLRAAAVPAHRRQKLQKLARTLGENIPPALVFPAYPYPDSSAPMYPPPKASAAGVVRTPKTPTSGSLRRAASASTARVCRRRSASVGALLALDVNARLPITLPARVPGSGANGTSRWEPPAEWAVGPADDEEQEPKGEPVLGAWNAEDYDDVLRYLRSLRK
ncbi:hypothetical protein DFH11DRAFT_634501 [Phellopilus nigrolimitatus]|nr:hypothetical protein DFH11DRAFT_634501 [Phellopilus nigrolimitatus]